jgi:threonine dehydrogenase-like Zn-dependent dehydrogenase
LFTGKERVAFIANFHLYGIDVFGRARNERRTACAGYRYVVIFGLYFRFHCYVLTVLLFYITLFCLSSVFLSDILVYMKCWQLKAAGELKEADFGSLELAEGAEEVKVRVTKAVISSTDLSIFEGKQKDAYPVIPARAAAGLVSEANSEFFKKGQRVFLSPYIDKEDGNFKIRGLDGDGFLTDYVILPETEVFTLPEGVTEESALFIEDIALALAVMEKLDVQKTEYLLIFGASALGGILGQLAIYYQAIPVLIDDDTERLARAEACGIYYTVNIKEDNLAQKIKEITGGQFAKHAALDTDTWSGTHSKEMFSLMKREGNFCLMGYNRAGSRLNTDISPILKLELNLCGANNGAKEIDSAINMLAMKAVKVEGYIEKKADFNGAKEFFKELVKETPFFKNYINI